MQPKRLFLPCILALFCISGCEGTKPSTTGNNDKAAKTTPSPKIGADKPATASTDQVAKPQPPSPKWLDPLRGKVKETAAAGGYTYVFLETPQGELWAAARKFTVAVGDEVELAGLMPMRNFRSPTLDRTFEEIQFVGRASVIGGDGAAPPAPPPTVSGLPPGHPATGGAAALPKNNPPAPPTHGEIEKLADGVTVADLFDKKVEFKGKLVRFRGRVVKANRGILGLNWMHIRDGSGSAGSNDITVTSVDGYAAPGSQVIIEGTLNLDKDFGAGYAYDVIVENAKVVIEPGSP